MPSATFTQALIAGGCAGTAVDTLFFPLDSLKTRLQSSQGFFNAGGFSGVYKGLGSVVIGSAPGAAAFFTTYESLKTHLPSVLSTSTPAPILHMLSASGGELSACLIRVPTEVIKSRQQTSAYGSAKGANALRAVVGNVWRTDGAKGFYRGFGSTIAREIPFTCIQFPLYERFKLLLASPSQLDRPLTAYEAGACGSVAGGIAAGLTTPLDVVKTRIMLELRTPPTTSGSPSANAGSRLPSGTFRVLLHLFNTEGPKALFSGIVPRVLWISAGGAVFLGVYEKVVGTEKDVGI
uniref:S-adenosylmethionine transporter n=1 Tax=Bartheletia paradoxa TaxID=669517 RepID=A0A2D0XHU7_9BASI|nr:hypothetical protein SPAR06868 [Bartheletia paradoxa]